MEPDGTVRVVKYTADDHNGFNAVVQRLGHAVHPQVHVIKHVPVAHVTHGIVGGGILGHGLEGGLIGGHGIVLHHEGFGGY